MSSPSVSPQTPDSFGELLAFSARFWEPRRFLYNLALFVVCLLWLTVSWPHFRPALHLSTLLPLAVLALFANLCYCAAYVVDIPLLSSPVRASWASRRWALWLAGMLVALLLENYWIADEIYPFVQ